MNVLVSIGNSDDRLSQAHWAAFIHAVRTLLDVYTEAGAIRVHGEWFSKPDSPWQNANWCFEPLHKVAPVFVEDLIAIRKKFGQDSIAWTEGQVQFL